MTENPGIIFFGTPEFAVASLSALVKAKFRILAVVTAPDKPSGRGLKPKSSQVKEYAEMMAIPVLQPLNLKDPHFLEQLNSFHPDLQIVIAFRMMPRSVWALPPMGTFNLHASLLPQYRGAAPINRVIMNGETETGLTTFFLNEQIDAGKIILSRKFPIGTEETAGELHDRLMEAGAELVVETVTLICNNQVSEISQDMLIYNQDQLKTAPKIFKEDCRIDWNRTVFEVYNQIRGLSPYPGAYTTLDESGGSRFDLKIFRAKPYLFAHNLTPGTFRRKGKLELIAATVDGYLEIHEVQMQGRKMMKTADFIRGYGHLFSEMQEI